MYVLDVHLLLLFVRSMRMTETSVAPDEVLVGLLTQGGETLLTIGCSEEGWMMNRVTSLED